MTTGPGSETIRVDPTDQLYIVNWNTGLDALASGATYRITVCVVGAIVGYADVQVFPTAGSAKNAATGDGITLVDGRTLPIKFRIERGMVVGVSVTPSPATVILKKTAALAVTLTDAHGNVVTDQPVSWSSNPSTTATVDASGTVTGVALGSATVIASSNGLSGSAQVNVIPPPVASVTVAPPAATVITKKTVQLTPTLKDADGNVLTGRVITWSTADPTIATVDATGLVTGVSAGGPVTITAASEGKAGSAQLTVIVPPVASIVVSPAQSTIKVGQTTPLTATTYDADGNVLPGRLVTWQSSNSTGASVDQTGVVTGDQAATTPYTITATSERVTGTAQVTVNPAGFTAVALNAGDGNTCATTSTGAAYCWGGWGFGSPTGSHLPYPTGVGITWRNVNGYSGDECGLASSGTIYCWGDNNAGQLGDGTSLGHDSPKPIVSDRVFQQLTDHAGTHCALDTSNQTWCWGRDIGPNVIQTPGTFTSLAGGSIDVCGLTSAGAAYCWGELYGWTPSLIPGGHVFTQITVGLYHHCGLDTDGQAWCWGGDLYGQLGDGTTNSPQWTPVRAGVGYRFVFIVAGTHHTCGIVAGGQAYCWGANTAGVLGDGTTTDHDTPVAVATSVRFVAIAIGDGDPTGGHMCGLATDGSVYCWGSNYNGELGDGTTINRMTPVRVQPPEGSASQSQRRSPVAPRLSPSRRP